MNNGTQTGIENELKIKTSPNDNSDAFYLSGRDKIRRKVNKYLNGGNLLL